MVGIDIRDESDERILACVGRLEQEASVIAAGQDVSISVKRGALTPAVPADGELVELLHEVAERHADKVLRLPSGASHDAQIMAAITPIAMLFVPSESGVSHNAAESTAPADLIAGARALAGVVAALDRRP
jgi:N-carbamoyl-L-amino-acid hydrolase